MFTSWLTTEHDTSFQILLVYTVLGNLSNCNIIVLATCSALKQ